jgi:hypothetical protein
MKHSVVVMLQIETDDPRLSDGALAKFGSIEAVAAVRAAVVDVVPRDIARVIAVFPVEHARLLMMLHEAVGKDLGNGAFVRPPAGYVPPTRE